MARRRGPNGKCAVCVSDHRIDIEAAMARGASARAAAKKYGAHEDACWRHWKRHTPDAIKANYFAGKARALADLQDMAIDEDTGILGALRVVRNGLYSRYEGALSADDTNGVAILAGRLHENLQMAAKITGELRKFGGITNLQVNNILLAPQVVELQAAVLRALRAHPDARNAVIRELRALEDKAAAPAVNGAALPVPVETAHAPAE